MYLCVQSECIARQYANVCNYVHCHIVCPPLDVSCYSSRMFVGEAKKGAREMRAREASKHDLFRALGASPRESDTESFIKSII